MLKRLKKLIGSLSASPSELELPLSELPEWYEAFEESYKKNIMNEIAPLVQKLQSNIHQISQKLDEFENASLPNPNITVKEQQFMEGNRTAFIRATRRLLEKLNLPSSTLPVEKCQMLKHNIEEYLKATHKQYLVLKEFFENEARSIAVEVRELDSTLNKIIHKCSQYNLDLLQDSADLLDEINRKNLLKSELNNEFKKLDSDKKKIEKRLTEKQQELEVLQNSPQAAKARSLKKELEAINHLITAKKEFLRNKFSPLKSALKKFAKLNPSYVSVIESYSSEPSTALATDFDLVILQILSKLSDLLDDGKIELKEKKSLKLRQLLKEFDEDFLKKFLQEYNNLHHKKIELTNLLEKNTLLEQESKLKSQICELKARIDSLNSKIQSNRNQLKKQSIDNLINRLEKLLSSLTKSQVRVTI